MKAKVKDIIEQYGKDAAEIEFACQNDRRRLSFDEYGTPAEDDDVEAKDWYLMGEQEYNRTFFAETSEYFEFEDLYGDENAEVLIIVVPSEEDLEHEELEREEEEEEEEEVSPDYYEEGDQTDADYDERDETEYEQHLRIQAAIEEERERL